MTLQNLSLWDVAIAALLIVVNGVVSVALKLDLERKLAWAAVRTVVQLLAIGYVLGWVFRYDRWFVVLPLMVVMTLIAGFAGAQRGSRTYAGQRADSVLSIWVSSWLVAAVGLFVVIRIHPWYEPQYAIPILGMILGNTLTGVSLGIERMTEELTARRDRVDMVLALGATRWEAAQAPARQAVRAGMMPTLNQMAVARHDDRAGAGRSVAIAGGALSDRDHVPDRGGVGFGDGGRGAAHLSAALLGGAPVSVGAAGGAGCGAALRGKPMRNAFAPPARWREASMHEAGWLLLPADSHAAATTSRDACRATSRANFARNPQRFAVTATSVPSLSVSVFVLPLVGIVKRRIWLTVTSFGHLSVLPPLVTVFTPWGVCAWKLNCTDAVPSAATTGAKRICV